jgi:uncharacterized membrane protein
MKNLLYMLAVAIVVFLIEALLIKYLWNLLFPEMFNAPFLDFWQALSILLLCNILFKTHSIKKSEDWEWLQRNL